jgi:very-short-patch-repair endonuclease
MEWRRNTDRARQLRASATDSEHLMWRHLRGRRLRGFKFRRQFPISGYVVDFVCLDAKLIIEVDGCQHTDNVEPDARRSEILSKSGFRVVRFWNNDVLARSNDVLAEILRNLQAPPSPQPLSRQRERG